MWDDMARNKMRKKGKVRLSGWSHTDTSSDGVKLPLQCGETRWAEPVQQHVPPVSPCLCFFATFVSWSNSTCSRETNLLKKRRQAGDRAQMTTRGMCCWEQVRAGHSFQWQCCEPVPLSAHEGGVKRPFETSCCTWENLTKATSK